MLTESVIRIILSVIILIIMIVILTRFRAGKSQAPPRDSLHVLKKRLEKGEITQEEYDEAKKKRGK
ncbi:putative membrane protein [Virgibacillus natechei]|uniref:Membrane protein n=1 Tax=Virgibacillus natechei TaxID=1216297 RepID=A0ABS4IC07_9BACI|nr:SHOCT domain-containing protein [Virgibacillus natechei]MBP1968467.1 putative membrane protein [Virgibacillus natechei]UZD13586.1 SHOCT domain-containing protein [Virgibacillus natechei]